MPSKYRRHWLWRSPLTVFRHVGTRFFSQDILGGGMPVTVLDQEPFGSRRAANDGSDEGQEPRSLAPIERTSVALREELDRHPCPPAPNTRDPKPSPSLRHPGLPEALPQSRRTSSTGIAGRFAGVSRDEALGMAQESRTPFHSSRKSWCKWLACFFCTTRLNLEIPFVPIPGEAQAICSGSPSACQRPRSEFRNPPARLSARTG